MWPGRVLTITQLDADRKPVGQPITVEFHPDAHTLDYAISDCEPDAHRDASDFAPVVLAELPNAPG